jgi:hypothetical protein
VRVKASECLQIREGITQTGHSLNNINLDSFQMSIRPQKKIYRSLIVILLVGLLVLGIGFIFFTNFFLQSIKSSPQQTPEQARLNKDLLLLGITMVAGLPAIGIGTYLMWLGNQKRITSPKMKGPLLMVSGGLIIVCSLVLPLVVWWMSQTL